MHSEILAQDVRALLLTPAFTVAAVWAMALGIGAGTAVFSVVDRSLFRSLPYPDDGRLLSLDNNPKANTHIAKTLFISLLFLTKPAIRP